MIPTTRDQAILLLEAADWDPDRLTPEQIEAIRLLYDLAEYSAIADDLEPGNCRCSTDGTVCGRYGTEECTCNEHHDPGEVSG